MDVHLAGRQLKQMSKNGTTVQFMYDHNGLRTRKTVTTNGTAVATYYTLHGKNIVHVIKNSDHLHIFYDAQNRPAKVSFNGTFYTYLHNLQGDIVGLLDKNGALAVEYKYDAWGKPLSITGTHANTLGKLNPFRYRGYVYDEETGLYYLRRRYYSASLSRFVSADNRIEGKSLYAYCFNLPTMYGDWDGTQKSTSDSNGDITDFTREGFKCIVFSYAAYDSILAANVHHEVAILYIPYQDIQYYNNYLLFQSPDPNDILKDGIKDKFSSFITGKITDALNTHVGIGTILSAVLTTLGMLNDFLEAHKQKKVKENHKAAQQLATDKKTGMYVIIDKPVARVWKSDPAFWPRGGYYVDEERDVVIQYCEKSGIGDMIKSVFKR